MPGHGREDFQDRPATPSGRGAGRRCAASRPAGSPAQAGLGRGAEQHAVEPADVAVFQDLQFQPLSSSRPSSSVAAPKTRERVLRVHLRGHRREGEDALDAQVLGVARSAWRQNGYLPMRRLGLAEEDDEVVLRFGSVQTKKRLRGRRPGWMTPLLDLDLVDVEEVAGLELGDGGACRAWPAGRRRR